MRALMGVVAVAAIAASAVNGQPKKVGALLVRASAAQVAKAFEADRATALKKFTPEKAPPGVKAGKSVEIYGEVVHTLPGRAGLQMTRAGYTVTFKGTVTGTGKYATINVKSVTTGKGLAVFEGEITCSDDPPKE